MSRTAIIAGATGLVGSHVLQRLLADPTWSRVVALGRRPLPALHEKLEHRIMHLGALDSMADLPRVDDVFCCLGTTIKQAGSQDAFRRVDLHYVVALARAGIRAGATQFLVISAVGADPASRLFYNRAKGEAEAAVRKLPYRGVQILRPSLLLGQRAEFRLGERIAMVLSPLVSFALIGRLRRYRPVEAATVARAMVQIAKEAPRGPNVFEYDAIVSAAGT